jgi:beta-lactamase regulating signal transducer with metallopeptidase domain
MSMPLWVSNLGFWSAQVALLALAAGILPRLFQIRNPRVLLIYWRVLLLLTFLLPLLQPWRRLPSVAPVVVYSSAVTAHSSTPPSPALTHWYVPNTQVLAEAIGIAILGGVVLRFALLTLGLFKLRRLREASRPITDIEASVTILDRMLATVGVRADFRLSSSIDSPVTFGLASPLVLLPESFLATDARMQSVIACHELLHVRRKDWAQHLIEEVLRAVFWFHPAIAWIISRVRVTREQFVDLEVVRLTNARKAYLEALLEFTRRQTRTAALPAPPFLAEQQLVERISLMLKEVHMSRGKLIASLAVISCCLVLVVGLSAWSLPLTRAPLQSLSTTSDSNVSSGGVSNGISEGISGGVAGGVNGGVSGGVSGSVVPAQTSSDIPQVDSSSIWIDTVKRGPMLRQVRGLGKLIRAAGSTNLIAQATVPAYLTADVKADQNASVASQKGPIGNGHVISIRRTGSDDTRTIDVAFDTKPEGADANLVVDVTIDIEKIDNTLQVHRPVHSVANKEISLYKLDNSGTDATLINVKFGRASVNSIEVLAGLKEGDRIILSDMSQVGNADHIHLTKQ